MARGRVAAEVQVAGLRELTRRLQQTDEDLAARLRDRLRQVGQIIVADAQGRVPVGRPPSSRHPGRARSTVRAVATRTGVAVRAGGRRAPYFRWLDFGGTLRPSGRRRNTISRPVIPGGRYVYPAVEARRAEVVAAAAAALEETLEEAS